MHFGQAWLVATAGMHLKGVCFENRLTFGECGIHRRRRKIAFYAWRFNRGKSGRGYVFVLLWRIAGGRNRAYYDTVNLDRQSPLERHAPGQRERRDPPVSYLLLEVLARAAIYRRGPCLVDTHLNAGHLRVVEATQDDRVAAVVHHGDDDGCIALLCFSLGGIGQLIGNLQREFLLDWQFRCG